VGAEKFKPFRPFHLLVVHYFPFSGTAPICKNLVAVSKKLQYDFKSNSLLYFTASIEETAMGTKGREIVGANTEKVL